MLSIFTTQTGDLELILPCPAISYIPFYLLCNIDCLHATWLLIFQNHIAKVWYGTFPSASCQGMGNLMLLSCGLWLVNDLICFQECWRINLDDHTADIRKGSPFTPLTTNNPARKTTLSSVLSTVMVLMPWDTDNLINSKNSATWMF